MRNFWHWHRLASTPAYHRARNRCQNFQKIRHGFFCMLPLFKLKYGIKVCRIHHFVAFPLYFHKKYSNLMKKKILVSWSFHDQGGEFTGYGPAIAPVMGQFIFRDRSFCLTFIWSQIVGLCSELTFRRFKRGYSSFYSHVELKKPTKPETINFDAIFQAIKDCLLDNKMIIF